jgi:hypothetical protein
MDLKNITILCLAKNLDWGCSFLCIKSQEIYAGILIVILWILLIFFIIKLFN